MGVVVVAFFSSLASVWKCSLHYAFVFFLSVLNRDNYKLKKCDLQHKRTSVTFVVHNPFTA